LDSFAIALGDEAFAASLIGRKVLAEAFPHGPPVCAPSRLLLLHTTSQQQ